MKKIAIFLLLLSTAAVCKDHKKLSSIFDTHYSSVVPLGAERIDLRPSPRSLYILATAESPHFDGWYSPQDSHMLLHADGSRVERYPQQITIRLTATAMRPNLLTIDSYGTLRIPDDAINSYLLNLHFRMLIFHGLNVSRIEPVSVNFIGMPADIHYDERIYEVMFETPQPVPIGDRIVVEVLSPTEDRLCKFHLDLF